MAYHCKLLLGTGLSEIIVKSKTSPSKKSVCRGAPTCAPWVDRYKMTHFRSTEFVGFLQQKRNRREQDFAAVCL